MKLEVEAASQSLEKTIRNREQEFSRVVDAQFHKWARFSCDRFVAERLSGGAGALRRRTGNLARSFKVRFQGKGLAAQARFATDARYARTQERGKKNIRPRRAKYLAIPIDKGPALKPGGQPRYPSGDGHSLRDTLPTDTHRFWIYRSPEGQLFLMGAKITASGKASQSKLGRPQKWFILKKSVSVPGNMRFRKSIEAYTIGLKNQLVAMAKQTLGK